jgi:hypothetical protein
VHMVKVPMCHTDWLVTSVSTRFGASHEPGSTTATLVER